MCRGYCDRETGQPDPSHSHLLHFIKPYSSFYETRDRGQLISFSPLRSGQRANLSFSPMILLRNRPFLGRPFVPLMRIAFFQQNSSGTGQAVPFAICQFYETRGRGQLISFSPLRSAQRANLSFSPMILLRNRAFLGRPFVPLMRIAFFQQNSSGTGQAVPFAHLQPDHFPFSESSTNPV